MDGLLINDLMHVVIIGDIWWRSAQPTVLATADCFGVSFVDRRAGEYEAQYRASMYFYKPVGH